MEGEHEDINEMFRPSSTVPYIKIEPSDSEDIYAATNRIPFTNFRPSSEKFRHNSCPGDFLTVPTDR
jgi:hypothetical protein